MGNCRYLKLSQVGSKCRFDVYIIIKYAKSDKIGKEKILDLKQFIVKVRLSRVI